MNCRNYSKLSTDNVYSCPIVVLFSRHLFFKNLHIEFNSDQLI